MIKSLKKVNILDISGLLFRNDGEIDEDIIGKIQVGWLKWRSASYVLCDRKAEFRFKENFIRW